MGREYVHVVAVPAGATAVRAGDLWRVRPCRAGAAGTNRISIQCAADGRPVGRGLLHARRLLVPVCRQPVLQGRRVGARRRVGRLLDGGGVLGCARPQSDRPPVAGAGSELGDAGAGGGRGRAESLVHRAAGARGHAAVAARAARRLDCAVAAGVHHRHVRRPAADRLSPRRFSRADPQHDSARSRSSKRAGSISGRRSETSSSSVACCAR